MIRSIQDFERVSILTQNTDESDLGVLSELSFDDNAFKKGGFANIHHVISLNRIEKTGLLVKIYRQNEHSQHAFNTIEKLHIKLKREEIESGLGVFQKFPTLLGLPFIAFKAVEPVEEEIMVGLVMYDLSELGFFDYGDDEQNHNLLEIEDAVPYCFQLVKSIKVLHDLEFVHSDLKSASIFINPIEKRIALIDFDSGYHFKLQDRPSTPGSYNGWLRKTNFIKNVIKLLTGSKKPGYEDYLHNELWAMNAAIFQFFTRRQTPYNFLRTLDDKEKEAYIKQVSWPKFRNGFAFFNSSAEEELQVINQILSSYNEIGMIGISELLQKSFNGGYFNLEDVATPQEWLSYLENYIKEFDVGPKIYTIVPSKGAVDFANEEILIEWKAEDYDFVSTNSQISKIGHTGFKLKIPDDTEIEVTFHNFYQSVSQKVSIKANRRIPVIKFFQSDSPIRTSEFPIQLKWEIEEAYEVRVNGKSYPYLKTGEIEVEPIGPTTYTLECKGGFGEVSKSEIFVDVIRPTIDEFSYEINLDHGLENIDLKWKTSNALSAEIFPTVGETTIEGMAHVSIKGETEFTILAKGLFFSEQKVLKAKPFPIPIIKELMVEFPKIELNTQIKMAPLKIPDPVNQIGKINFSTWNMPAPRDLNFFSDPIDFKKLDVDQFKTYSFQDEHEGLSLRRLIDKVFSYFKNRPDGKAF